jgi:hypothetical protein
MLEKVLEHLQRVTASVAFVVVATREARTILPDGRNAHLIVENADWWTWRLTMSGWTIESSINRKDKEVQLTIVKDRK